MPKAARSTQWLIKCLPADGAITAVQVLTATALCGIIQASVVDRFLHFVYI